MKSDRAKAILRGLRALLSGAALLLAVPAVAQAATVMNLSDSGAGSLRAAIANTASGGTVDFQQGLSGTITLTGGVLAISQSVNIVGPGAGIITVNGNQNTTVFDIAPSLANQNVTISGLTITGGAATTNGGGILTNNTLASLTLNGDTITGNQVTLTSTNAGGGGGVYVNGGTLNVSNSTITNNKVSITGTSGGSDGGGGIYSNGGGVMITSSDVSRNMMDQASSSGDNGGGGIYSNGGAVTVNASTVLDNSSSITSDAGGDNGGGGIHSEGGGVTLGSSTVNGNSFTLGSGTGGDNGGGGVYEDGGAVTVALSSIDGNTLTVRSDTAGDDGGAGLASEGGNIGVAFSSISDNSGNITDTFGDDGGGAILDEGGRDVYLTSTFSGNSMTVSGGGSDNGGGAIYSWGDSLISNLTIAGNDVNAPGGALLNHGQAEFKNTIVADNTATPAGNCAGTGTFTSTGFNLESTRTCGLNATGDLVNTEPGLGPLQNNGGLTLTQALSAGSPAVDAGSCTDLAGNPLTTDQRGVARPQPAGGKCDIGAYELVPAAPAPPAAVAGQPAATSSTGAGFSGSVNPEGQATTVFFQYGLDARYRPGGGTAVIYDESTPPQTLPADSAAHAVTATASGLVPNALYHVRLVATNATGTTNGPDQTFTTPSGPAPPPPTVGKTVNAAPVSGQVFVLVGTKLIPLTEAQQLPSGAVIDAQNGTIQLTAATGIGHKRETGTFGGAIFRLNQARAGSARGLTTLSLVEGAFAGAPSYASCKAHHATDGTAAAASKRTLQLLHASAHGKFSTRGRYSAATVLGTKWTIADRCDGTLVHDITDSVVVNDLVHHKRIVLHAGQSYLARPRAHK